MYFRLHIYYRINQDEFELIQSKIFDLKKTHQKEHYIKMDILLDEFAILSASDADGLELGKRDVNKINKYFDSTNVFGLSEERRAYRIVIEKIARCGENELGRVYFYENCGEINTLDIGADAHHYYFMQ